MPTNCPRCRGRMVYEIDHVAGACGTCVNCGYVAYANALSQEEAEAEVARLRARSPQRFRLPKYG